MWGSGGDAPSVPYRTTPDPSPQGGGEKRRLVSTGRDLRRAGGLHTLYISPLKALAVDVERNLRAPLAGLRSRAERLGLPPPELSVAIRSGDTPAEERRGMERRPPDILITTPESFYLLLTSAARRMLSSSSSDDMPPGGT